MLNVCVKCLYVILQFCVDNSYILFEFNAVSDKINGILSSVYNFQQALLALFLCNILARFNLVGAEWKCKSATVLKALLRQLWKQNY